MNVMRIVLGRKNQPDKAKGSTTEIRTMTAGIGSRFNPIEIWRRRELLWALTLREIQVRYTQSVLGIAWAVLQPLALMLMFTLIFSVLLKVPSEGVPYPVFSYSALTFWTFFSGSLTRAIPSLEANEGLIKKIYFPREFFPISSVLSAIFDLVIAFVIFLVIMLYYHTPFTLNMFYVVPLVVIQTIFTIGVCMFASAFNVYYRDVKYALPLIVQLWMYATPIIYPMSSIPERLWKFYLLNPMTGIIESYRSVLVKGSGPQLSYVGVAAGGAILLFVLGYFYFKRIEMSFADVI
jgi:lipopolysaccharide transport system permease protein